MMAISRVQSSWIVIWSGWLFFVSSLFMPATSQLVTAGRDSLFGWQAALASIHMYSLWGVMLVLSEPRFLPLWLCPWLNLATVLAPFLVFRNSDNDRRLASVLCIGPVGAIVLAHFNFKDLFIGFYIWALSLGVTSFGCWWHDRAKSTYSDRFSA